MKSPLLMEYPMTFMIWLFVAMLIPVWIPLIAVVFGGIADAIQRRRGTHTPTGAAAVVAELRTSNELAHAAAEPVAA
jgi:hypothetical protein